MTDWKPLSVRESGDSSDYDGPFDGVPDWLFGPLWDWFKNCYPLMVYVSRTSFPRAEARDDFRRIGLALGVALENIGGYADADEMQSRLRGIFISDRTVFVNAIDYWLAHDSKGRKDHAAVLDSLLQQGRSAWRVILGAAGTPLGLVRRVAPEAQTLAETLMRERRAGEHLARAWKAAYGRSGNPNDAYWESIKAVEAAAKPVVSPDNRGTTLGTIIRDMKAKPEKWSVRLRHERHAEQTATLMGMLDLLWAGQDGTRHGDSDESRPMDVSQEDAEAALHLAVTLVHWFTSGVVARTQVAEG